MEKKYTITIVILSVVLCISLVGTAVLSGTLTKYATSSASRALARVAKWGIDIDAGSDLSTTYRTSGNVLMLSTSGDKAIMPATIGSLTYVKTAGSPEVKYDIDIDGDKKSSNNDRAFSIGNGYLASSKLIRGEDGKPVEYFPIIIRFVIFDIEANGTKNVTFSKTYAIKRNDSVHVDVACTNVSNLIKKVNADIDTVLDVANNAPNPNLNRVYSVEWEWIGQPDAGSYQTNYLDTALSEVMAKPENRGAFGITLDLKFEMRQSQ